MNTQTVGTVIAKLRKEKSITQEELASRVGVSSQAVSKWENGGMPDAELLPRIADFLEVSIDTLFGRSLKDQCDFAQVITAQFEDKNEDQKIQTMFKMCWEMEKAMFYPGKSESLEEIRQSIGDGNQTYSSIVCDSGFTRVGIGNRLPYFLLVPESKDKEKAFFDGIDYTAFFKDFSDQNVFDAMVMLNKRKNRKAFTDNLLVKKMDIDKDTAADIIRILQKYRLIHVTQIEMDDEEQEIYTFNPTPSFIALLIFAREMIDRPSNFSYYMGNRNQPYL
ncbi:MAG: helix-turn-helix transcriptional regulator [Acetatifactor sp.]|nr:helix-turn-helix transcriptional regulator [Acetatifactor sp.]